MYITASGAQTITQGTGSYSTGMLITVNSALTGTITVADNKGTEAIITNPGVGAAFRYYGLIGTVTVNPSAACDLQVSILNHQV